MANTPIRAYSEIRRDCHWEDYRSLKQYYRNHICNEVIYAGSQLTTAAFADISSSDTHTIARPAANGYAYIWSEADLAALDGDSVYIDFVDSTGKIHLALESVYDDQTGTDEQVPVGHAGGTRHDTVAAVNGDVLTMTNLDSATANDLAGLTVLGLTGEQAGNAVVIASNTAAAPTLATCTTTPNANWAGDTVAVGTFPADVYRIRRMWVETESPADNGQLVGDVDGSNIYAGVEDANSRSAITSYFAPSSYDATGETIDFVYLGYVHAVMPYIQDDEEDHLNTLRVFFTPYSLGSTEVSGVPSDGYVDLSLPNGGEFTWQPCIRLEPNTDVIFQIKKELDADHTQFWFEYKMLEVTQI
ncbi:MAG: hypothetical protein GY861_24645 [bacterium]|nr:hypothetical protein [bacterium]